MLKRFSKVVAAAALLTFSQLGVAQQKLTILWAQWDPANYLQELVKDYEKQTGTKVVVETTPWPDFQNKASRNSPPRARPTTWWSVIRNGSAPVPPVATTSI